MRVGSSSRAALFLSCAAHRSAGFLFSARAHALQAAPYRAIATMTARTPSEMTGWDIAEACRATLLDYAAVADGYAQGNMNHDVSQNIDAMLRPLVDRPAPLDILDVCCASGRDLLTFKKMGHRAVGLDGVPRFCELSRAHSGCEVLEQDLSALSLTPERADSFDAIFCNACLFHLPSAALPAALAQLRAALREGGILFCSNAHGFGKDNEGWTDGRTDGTRSYVCWLSEQTWKDIVTRQGFELLESFYRPPGKPRAQQPFLATVWRKPARGESAD